MILGYTEQVFIGQTSRNRSQLTSPLFCFDFFNKVTIYVYLNRDSDRTRHWILAEVAALKIIGRIIHHIFRLPLKLMVYYANFANNTPNALQSLLEAATFQMTDEMVWQPQICSFG